MLMSGGIATLISLRRNGGSFLGSRIYWKKLTVIIDWLG